ncbi:hypothetical protein [Bosea sp. BH3]|uniref:hypothetical protein n=1 Tax=Bosea sp. BH3 TaxID=2871701 RepID=UPI0021CB7F09|nr:hypothetical protein [Bosea sp. BH3]MCU4180042.1 hypothetical protein [Bosea sp. BH3]
MAVYAAAIEISRPRITLYPDQQAYNLARAERALLAEGHPSTVLVGSSLGVRIPDDWLPENWLNLSLGGMGPTTGLALIEAGGLRPRRVVVEINTVDVRLDGNLQAEASGPIPLALRKAVRGLRIENRPINLLLSGFGALRPGSHQSPGPGGLKAACEALPRTPDAIAADVVAREVERQIQAPVPAELDRRVSELKVAVEKLSGRGAEVVLLEWPVDPLVAAAPRQVAIRAAVRAALPGLRWLSPAAGELQTEDGLHLAPLSARQVACALELELSA